MATTIQDAERTAVSGAAAPSVAEALDQETWAASRARMQKEEKVMMARHFAEHDFLLPEGMPPELLQHMQKVRVASRPLRMRLAEDADIDAPKRRRSFGKPSVRPERSEAKSKDGPRKPGGFKPGGRKPPRG